MVLSRRAPRVAALLTTAALGGGLLIGTAPAQADGNNTVTVTVSTTSGSWTAYLECTTASGAHVSRQVPMTYIWGSPVGVFTGVPNGTCDTETVRSTYPESGGTAYQKGFAVTSNTGKTLNPVATLNFVASAVSVTGLPILGHTLTATATFDGGIVDPASVVYTWYRSGSTQPVWTSTTPTYTVVLGDLGHLLSAKVTGRVLGLSAVIGTASGGPATATPAVPTTTTTPTTAPAVEGKPRVGQTLTAAAAPASSGTMMTGYQWYVRKVIKTKVHKGGRSRLKERVVLIKIKGANSERLRLKERLAGKHVVVGVTYSQTGLKSTTIYSKPIRIKERRGLKE